MQLTSHCVQNLIHWIIIVIVLVLVLVVLIDVLFAILGILILFFDNKLKLYVTWNGIYIQSVLHDLK